MARVGYVSVRIGEDLDKLVQEYCVDNDLQVSQVIRAALREFFEVDLKDTKEVLWKKIAG